MVSGTTHDTDNGVQRELATSHRVAKPFVGVDGEGGNDENGYHAYFLLRAGDDYIVPRPGDTRLTSYACLEFLANLPKDCIYVAFFFDYDVTKILEDLPWIKLHRLMNRDLRKRRDTGAVMPVTWGPFEIDYLPRKEFKVRVETGNLTKSGKPEYSPWTVINDVGSFFQCRFTKALETWQVGTDDELAEILSGKMSRGIFTLSDVGEVIPYNALEIKLLQLLMEKFREACVQAGYLPNRWQGPGLLAEAAFQRHGVPRSKDVPFLTDQKHAEVRQFALNAFYGGRPELMAVGPVDRVVYQWDINSAYPHAMRFVPCLLHGEWVQQKSLPRADFVKQTNYALAFGTFVPKKQAKTLWYGLPIRDGKTGGISYPGSGRGWYWNFEIHASIHQQFKPETVWVYKRKCECKPLQHVEKIYRERLALGKDGPGIVLKLLLNSKYGKTAQSIGSPKYSNPVWASFITAFCRTQIQEFIHSSPLCDKGFCGEDILMVATDSLCTWSERTDLIESQELGGWSKEVHADGVFFIQPGVYFGTSTDKNGGRKQAKTRGVPREVFVAKEAAFRAAYDRMIATGDLNEGYVRVPQKMFCGIRYALHRRNQKLLGQWVEFENPKKGTSGKRVAFDWSSERDTFPLGPNARRKYLVTLPKPGDPSVETVPYSKDIGGLQDAQQIREFFDSHPDGYTSTFVLEGQDF